MSIKSTIRFRHNEGDQPGWPLYTEMFDEEDIVYLEVEGAQADVTMIRSSWGPATGTVLLRLPTNTGRQLGLVPAEWKNDDSRLTK